jgi:hypothetical protein
MKKLSLALSAGLVLAAGCDTPTVTNENSPTVEALQGALTSAGVQTLALGVLASDRSFVTSFNYTVQSEIFARNAYRIDPNEPRYVTETLGGTPDPGSFSGSGAFGTGYTTIRSAITLIDALPGADKNAISDAQRAATTGFIQTIKALEYYRLLEVRDTIGVAILTSDPNFVPPLSCKKVVLDYIAALLDSANTNLVAAGSASLPFTPPTGFTAYGRNYRLASNLVLLNRGLKGKVDVYRGLQHQSPTAGAFTAAITELTQALRGAAPGAVSSSTFGNGAYVTFVAGGTENTPNPLFDARIGVNPKAQAALQAGDTRSSKIVTRPGATVAAQTLAGSGLTTTLTYVGALTSNTANQTRPMAILRDEEIVLLRAQAYFEAGQFANGAADLNSVRTSYGLAAIAVPATIAEARTALLYEKRYSLFFEGPQRLVDLRAYSLLKAGITPAELPNDPFNTALPIPKAEADARGNVLTVVCS